MQGKKRFHEENNDSFPTMETRSTKRKRLVRKFMGEMLTRFPHLGQKIFDSLIPFAQGEIFVLFSA